MDDTAAARRELERAMDELRMEGVVVLSNIRGRALADPVYRPFFEEADRRKVCVFVQPMIPGPADAFTEYVLGPIVGFPIDTTVAIAKLCYAGVFKQSQTSVCSWGTPEGRSPTSWSAWIPAGATSPSAG